MAYTTTHKHGQYMTIWEWWILFLYQHDWTAPVFWGSHHIHHSDPPGGNCDSREADTPTLPWLYWTHHNETKMVKNQDWNLPSFFPGFMGGHSPTQGPSLRSPTSLWPRLFQRQMPCHLSAVERRLCENVRWHSLWYCGWKKSCTSW